MKRYFNIFIEFDRQTVDNKINEYILKNNKGYVCVIDGNVLATANKQKPYLKIINRGLINTCDGSSIALFAGLIHKAKFNTYTGPEIFSKYIGENYTQFFLGNTSENLNLLKKKFETLGYRSSNYRFMSLPFKDVNEFEYEAIAREIQLFSPDIIWVSLGAPKQEIFISKLIPHLEKGVVFAIGAAFNLFLGDKKNKRAPKILRKLNLEWLFRVAQEPRRIGRRALSYSLILPRLIIQEYKQQISKSGIIR